jgi:CubicO group peptidase (beta-lactamase class C family)
MKFIYRAFKWTFVIIATLVMLAYVTGNQFLIKGIWAAYLHGNTSATISDIQFFDTRTVEVGTEIPWRESVFINEVELSDKLRGSLEETQSVAYLMAKNGEIIHEEYWDGYGQESRSNSFSMAKSITTMLVQCAIQDGAIESWDTKATSLLPELKGEYANNLTLRNLSTMTAGLDFNEHYTNPFDITAKLYYGPDVERLLFEQVPVHENPGSFEYQSGATQLLGLALVRAVEMPLATYASEKLWKPLGAKHAAEWHLDNELGKELAFCCFNSNARDFARFGQMMLQKGNFNERQILDTSFVDMATMPFEVPYYGHSFWVTDDYGSHIFYQRGILGQYIIVVPEHDLVIVRLGHTRRPTVDHHSADFRVIVEEVLKSLS